MKRLKRMEKGDSVTFPCGTKLTIESNPKPLWGPGAIVDIRLEIPQGVGTLWVDDVHRQNARILFTKANIPDLIEILKRIEKE